MPKAIYTHSEYVTFVAFPLQQWLHESPSMLRYTYIPLAVLTLLTPPYRLSFGWIVISLLTSSRILSTSHFSHTRSAFAAICQTQQSISLQRFIKILAILQQLKMQHFTFITVIKFKAQQMRWKYIFNQKKLHDRKKYFFLVIRNAFIGNVIKGKSDMICLHYCFSPHRWL